MQHIIEDFSRWMQLLGYSPQTIKSYRRKLCSFIAYLQYKNIDQVAQIDRIVLNGFVEHLKTRPNKLKAGALSSRYIQSHLSVIRKFSEYTESALQEKFFTGDYYIAPDEIQKRVVLSQSEIKQLYNATDDSPEGYRSRAFLAVYYGCGLRASEGVRILLQHIDYQKKLLYVTPGKNYQGRYVPMSERVCRDLKAFEINARGYFTPTTDHLFTGKNANPLSVSTINKRLVALLDQANIQKPITLHNLRHSIATHLLQTGVPMEQIGKFLGHKILDATEVYVRVMEELELIESMP